MHVIGSFSSQGRRSYQQDRLFRHSIEVEGRMVTCIAVADGMGGQKDGHLAASAAEETLRGEIPVIFSKIRKAGVSFFLERGGERIYTLLEEIFKQANESVRALTDGTEDADRPGTTLVCAFIVDKEIWFANVGDSRAYLLTQEGLEQVTRDDTALQDALDDGVISPEEASSYPYGHVLSRCLDGGRDVYPEITYRNMENHDNVMVILSSDGFHNTLDLNDFRHLFSAHPLLDDQLARAGVMRAIEKGSTDNSTVIMCGLGKKAYSSLRSFYKPEHDLYPQEQPEWKSHSGENSYTRSRRYTRLIPALTAISVGLLLSVAALLYWDTSGGIQITNTPETTSGQMADLPASGQPLSVPVEPPPAAVERLAAPAEPPPASGQPLSVPVEPPPPAAVEPPPASEEPIPALVEPPPASVEPPPPAAVEPPPASEKPPPASEEPAPAPEGTNKLTLRTQIVENIGKNNARTGGYITSLGGGSITQRGVVWSTHRNPTIDKDENIEGTATKTEGESGSGEFVSELTGLSPGTLYFVRAYASNNDTTAYGQEHWFWTEGAFDSVEYHGHAYPTVKIGQQEWMAENLLTGQYRDSTEIAVQATQDQRDEYNEGAWVPVPNMDKSPDNIPDAKKDKLYNWHAAGNVAGLCPEGWRLPTNEDWITMERLLGLEGDELTTRYSTRGLESGAVIMLLKQTGYSDGLSSYQERIAKPSDLKEINQGFGFNIRFDGYADRVELNNKNRNISAHWWTSNTEKRKDETTAVVRRRIIYQNMYGEKGYAIDITSIAKGNFLSVRCVKESAENNEQ